jgi:uncharacterized repeat protein (TIGR01451 family)
MEVIMAYAAMEAAARAGVRGAGGGPGPNTVFHGRWTTTATDGPGQDVQGLPVTLTWSIVPDGTPVPGANSIGDADAPSDLRQRLDEIYDPAGEHDKDDLANQAWFPVVRAVFENLSARTGVRYVHEPFDDGASLGEPHPGVLGVRGDVRISGHPIDGPSGTLAYNYFPDAGDMVIDTGDSYFENLSNDSIRLSNTIEHEAGHGLGLEHVCPQNNTKIMEPQVPTAFRGIQFDATHTIQRQYGDACEHHGSARNNDTLAQATPLAVPEGEPLTIEWLSIDGASDVDCMTFPASAGSRITVRVTPGTQSYNIGPQGSDGTCSAGEPFDSGALRDLSLKLVAPDQATVLASSASRPAGQTEEIIGFVTPDNGMHAIMIEGSGADAAQLYRLEAEVEPPHVALALAGSTIVTESFAPPNAVIDPGETVDLQITLSNSGTLPATQVTGILSGPAGFTGFTTNRDYGTIGPSESATRSFVFGLEGNCGDTLRLDFNASADGGAVLKIPLGFTLGEFGTLLAESFDEGGSGLPPGWTSTLEENGSGWITSSAAATSGSSSAFAANTDRPGLSALVSPALVLGISGGTLSFSHLHNTEPGFDGGVLELSIDDGAWQDVLAAGGTFISGGYNRTLSNSFNNPLPGRAAWSGDSGGFTGTSVGLPPAFGGHTLRFRWRLGHDSSVGAIGWFIDDVSLTTDLCGQTSPAVTLALVDDTASEFSLSDTAVISLHAPLPPVTDLPVHFLSSGSATAGTDTSPLSGHAIPAGQTTARIEINAIPDTKVEGPETLVLSIDPASRIASTGTTELTLTVLDSPYGTWAAAVLGLDGPVAPSNDFDRDGALNLEEFAWQTAPASPFSRPWIHPRLDAGILRLDAPLQELPPSVRVTAESSTDLQSWSPKGIQRRIDGFQVPADDPAAFLRLRYDLLPSKP